ncbi:MAG: CCR4-NOT transcription complex subunit 11, partial [Paramarteilia canceri]
LPNFPKDLLNKYVLNCVSKIQKMTDISSRNRVVRLVSVYIQSLIRNKIELFDNVLIEVGRFSMDFDKIKEANALYKLIKSI